MFPKLKIYAGLVIALLLSFLGIQHFRNKAQSLSKELDDLKLADKVSKKQTDALIKAQQDAFQKVDDEVERSKHTRDYFNR